MVHCYCTVLCLLALLSSIVWSRRRRHRLHSVRADRDEWRSRRHDGKSIGGKHKGLALFDWCDFACSVDVCTNIVTTSFRQPSHNSWPLI